MNKTLFAAILGLAATPAFAQVGGAPFAGFYAGVQGGWQQDRQSLETTGGGATTSTARTGDGITYGGQIGYDGRVGGSTVVGAEIALTGRTGETRFSGFDLTQGRTVTATGRLGFMPGPESLVYARGGYANARFNLTDALGRQSEDRDGWTAGVGYEHYLSQTVSARVEYNYADFGRDRLSPAIGPNAELKYQRHAVTAGINFRF